ncbi:MAG: hypothetical protein JWM27_2523 [Gemmatimonadetes bacterium]|nr:hypothetical protein [Gemmatimonadota bacterium]
MHVIRRTGSVLPFALLATAVYVAEVLTVRMALPRSSSPGLMAAAVAFDLAVVLPAAFWFTFLRGRAPAWRIMPVLLLSLLGAAAVLPAAYRGVVPVLRFAAAPAELALVAMVVLRARRAFREAPEPGADAGERIRRASLAALPFPRVAELVAYEMALIYYALLGWRERPAEGPDVFSYHRRSGYGGIVFALAAATVMETAAVHLLVAPHSAAAAWAATGLSLYLVLWMIGDYQAVRLRPIKADGDALHLRVGLRWTASVPWDAVATLRDAHGALPGKRERGWLRMTAMGPPSAVLELRRPVKVRGPYGITRRVQRIGLAVDDAARFRAEVQSRTGRTP